MRNAIVSVSHKTVVVVRLRRDKMNCSNFSETTWASNLKIYHKVALKVYIFCPEMTPSATSGRLQIALTRLYSFRNFSITVQPILKVLTVLEMEVQVLDFPLSKVLDILPLDLENAAHLNISCGLCNRHIDLAFCQNTDWCSTASRAVLSCSCRP